MLLTEKWSEVDAVTNTEETPLMIAAEIGCNKLYDEIKSDIENEDGRTVLHLAALNNHHEMVKVLFKHSACIDIKGRLAWIRFFAQRGRVM